ncbi:PREDICTED: histone chaperone rtt106-like [Priapulus caudatus]|uniref:Histone chaperone rtt106-like n=1 Tax=Priapulus caudatus TaxID=37621 RepID=A0ABM1E4B0_PRICU|nr:PREDICTED: histone chaperone rtt106-like [Priapulus caudatus]
MLNHRTHYYNAEKGHDVFEDESSLSDFIVESDDNADYTSIDSHVEVRPKNGKDTPEHSDTIESDTTLRGRYTGSKCISDSSSESDSSKGGDESEKISAGSRYLKKSYHQIAIPSDDDEQDKDDASRNLKQGSGTKRRYSYINSSTSSSESEQEGIRKVLADEGTDCDNEQVVKHSERNVKLCEQRREKKEQMFTKLREQRDRQRNKSASNKVT